MSEASNYKVYREHLAKCGLPKLPYLGVFLTDLTMTNDAKKSNENERQSAMAKMYKLFIDMVRGSSYPPESGKVLCCSPWLGEIVELWAWAHTSHAINGCYPRRVFPPKETEHADQLECYHWVLNLESVAF